VKDTAPDSLQSKSTAPDSTQKRRGIPDTPMIAAMKKEAAGQTLGQSLLHQQG